MLRRHWLDTGIVMRYLCQPLSSIRLMTEREFKYAVMTACYWRGKELEAATFEGS